MAERILTLIAQKCGSIVSIGEVSLISAGGQNIFGFGQVRLLDDDVQIGEFSKRYVAVHRMRENRTLERRNRNTVLLEQIEQS